MRYWYIERQSSGPTASDANSPLPLSMRACLRAAHSSIRNLGIPSATAFAMPPKASTCRMRKQTLDQQFDDNIITRVIKAKFLQSSPKTERDLQSITFEASDRSRER